MTRLLRGGGDFSERGELQRLSMPGGAEALEFLKPAPYSYSVHTVGDNEFWLEGRLQPVLEMECSRCLEPVVVELQVPFSALLHYRAGVQQPAIEEGDGGEELLVFGKNELDISAFVAESVLMAAPLTVLHHPACKGLCQICGHDLNQGPCEHAAAVPIAEGELSGDKPSPFSALAGLDLPDDHSGQDEDAPEERETEADEEGGPGASGRS